MSTDRAAQALPELPKKRRAMFCTKCGFSGPTEAEASPQGAPCQRCDYIAFVQEVDYSDDEMRDYASAALTKRQQGGVGQAEREAAKSERRAITFGDIVHQQVIAMRAAVVACQRDGAEAGMVWIANTLEGPGHLPDAEDIALGAQELFDKETAEHEAFRATHPAPEVPAITAAQPQSRPSITITLRQARELVEFFGGSDCEIVITERDEGEIEPDPDGDGSPSPAGLWAHCADYPEDGSAYLGPTEVDDSLVTAQLQPDHMRECSWLDLARSKAAEDVLQERVRQVTIEGWTPAHDDEHARGELARAAACYATASADGYSDIVQWPWDEQWWKPKGRRHNLVRAAALIIAEVERLDRGAARNVNGGA